MSDDALIDVLQRRFGTVGNDLQAGQDTDLARLAGRGSCRAFRPEPPPLPLIRTLCATALAAPSKSDLQQRDILIVQDPAKVAALKELLEAQAWIGDAPQLLLFLANNRRQRLIQAMHAVTFANDHLDAFFNASLDAGLALAFFMQAAEAVGLGCCPISTIRNHLPEVARLFELPDHVFPVAALALGYPRHPKPKVTPRLGLGATVHVDRFYDTDQGDIEEYDARRKRTEITKKAVGPWSRGKADMYANPQRTDFANFVRSIGFRLE